MDRVKPRHCDSAEDTGPDYPSGDDLRRDRRGFLRLFGAILMGAVATLSTSARAVPADDPPVPGGLRPLPDPEPVPRGGTMPEPKDPEPIEPDDDDDDDDTDPPVPLPGEAPADPEPPEYELGGRIAPPKEPEAEKQE